LRTLLKVCVDQLGAVDVVIANAGIGDLRPLLEIDDDAWDRMMAVNLNGIFYLVQESARVFAGTGRRGAIVVTSSTNAFFPERHTVHYSTSKGAVLAFVRACALDLAELGVRINAISPGIIRTPLADPIVEDPVAAADYHRREHCDRRWGDRRHHPEDRRRSVVGGRAFRRRPRQMSVFATAVELSSDVCGAGR
jgi:NAD(P)-dependent dehydrogenase (short-subunit alcohol dehydrogenase family)